MTGEANTRFIKTSQNRPSEVVARLEKWLVGRGEGFKFGHHPSGLLIADFVRIGDSDDPKQRGLLTRAGGAAAGYTKSVDGFARPIVDGRIVPMMPREILHTLIVECAQSVSFPSGLGPATCAAVYLVLEHTEAVPIHGLSPEPAELPR